MTNPSDLSSGLPELSQGIFGQMLTNRWFYLGLLVLIPSVLVRFWLSYNTFQPDGQVISAGGVRRYRESLRGKFLVGVVNFLRDLTQVSTIAGLCLIAYSAYQAATILPNAKTASSHRSPAPNTRAK